MENLNKKSLTLRLNVHEHKKIKARAVDKNLSIKDYILKLVDLDIKGSKE